MNKELNYVMSKLDKRIEKGTSDPPGDSLYPRGVLNVLNNLFENENFQRPRGENSPTFSMEEIKVIAELLFTKPPNIVMKVYERIPHPKDIPIKRRLFINHFVSDANFNGAKAARMAGYSKRSAKQIAYKIKRT